MVEIVTGEFSKYGGTLVEQRGTMMAWLWDAGPEEPTLPKSPPPPSGKEGDPKFDLAKIHYDRDLKRYKQALEKYDADEREYLRWITDQGGATEKLFCACDARDALFYDKKAVAEGRQSKPRWYPSLRNPRVILDMLAKFGNVAITENGGLPPDCKPGHGQKAAVERELAVHTEFVAALKADPQLGSAYQMEMNR